MWYLVVNDHKGYMEQCVCVVVSNNQVSELFLGALGSCVVHTACARRLCSVRALGIFPPPLRVRPSGTVLVGPLTIWVPDHKGQEEREAKGLHPQLCSPKL